ncbi:MAG: hypothetical protein II589_00295, partial [Clostridia bacterium]|nr:hypothetical protein [Clostridia bacterium]
KASADDTEVKAVTADITDGTPKTEETKASADDTEVKADNTQAGEYILTETSIVIIEDANDEDDEFDEDVQIDDEQPFDESLDDIDLDQLADLDTTIEELTPVIDSDNNEASQMPPAVKPVIDITPENNSEKTENTPAAAEEPKAEPADAKEENKPAAAAADTPVQNETKAPEKKSFFSKTKDKLTELWNTKSVPIHLNHTDAPLQPEKAAEAQAQAHTEQHSEPQSDAAKPTEENKDLVPSASAQQSEQAEKKTDINIVPIENHTVFADSEPTPILRDDDDDEDEEQEEVLSEDLYKDLFDGGSEYEKFAKKIYGSNYKKKVDEESAKPARPKMTVITNDNIIDSTDIDSDKVRGTLNVIKRDPKEAILTEKQRKQEENNRIVLEKCEIFNQETAQRQAEARKERSERTAREYEKRFEQIKHVTELDDDNYIAPGSIDTIKVKSGNFSESVKFEYDFYIGYLKLKEGVRKTIKKDAPEPQEQTATAAEAPAAPQEKRPPKPETPKRQYSKSRDKLSGIIDALDEKDSKHPDAFEYRNENEASDVRRRLRLELTSYKSRFTISMLLTIAALILCMFSNKFSVGAGENAAGISVRIFAVINCVLYFAEIYNVRSIIKHGFKRITKLDTNRDTIIAAASAAAALQALLAVFTPSTFLKGGLNLYTIIIMFTLTINTYGRYKNAHRKSLNFRFVSDPDQKYTAKFFSDRRMLATLLSGTRNERSELVFQKKTSFLKHFIKLSKEHDPGEDIAKRISLPSLIITLIVTILYAALSKSFCDTISFLTIMLCSCVPICSQTLGALPLFKLSKTALENDSMVVGYPAIKEFADSAALMIDAKELYPEGAVHMETIKTFDNHRKDEAVLAAAAVMIAAGGAMAGMYDELIKNNTKVLPSADNVMYLDGKGLIGWVNNERYFIGTRELLISQRIEPMPLAYEQEQKKGGGEILYIARSGELVAMYIVTYSANGRVADVLSRMESTGVNLLIRTTDPNITADRIAKDFGISYQNIKILEQKNSNVIRDEMIGKERSYPAFIATKGGVTSFGKALTECIQTKGNISMSVVIQLVAVILEVLVIILFGLFAGVAHIHAVPCFIYGIFWTVAILAGPAIMQRLQHNSRL